MLPCVSGTTTTLASPIPAALTSALVNNSWAIALLIWFGVLTLIAIIILVSLIYVFHKMRKDSQRRERLNRPQHSPYSSGISKYSPYFSSFSLDSPYSSGIFLNSPHSSDISQCWPHFSSILQYPPYFYFSASNLVDLPPQGFSAFLYLGLM